MDQLKLTKQMIDFNRNTFENTFNAMVLLQEQTEKMVNSFMEQATWIPSDGKKVLTDWVETFKKGRGEFKKAVDESFVKVESFFAEAGKKQSA